MFVCCVDNFIVITFTATQSVISLSNTIREAPTYFVPAQLLPQIEQCRNAMSMIDSFTTTTSGDENKTTGRENLLKMTLVPVNPGDEFPLKGITYGSKTNFFVRAFEVDHA